MWLCELLEPRGLVMGIIDPHFTSSLARALSGDIPLSSLLTSDSFLSVENTGRKA